MEFTEKVVKYEKNPKIDGNNKTESHEKVVAAKNHESQEKKMKSLKQCNVKENHIDENERKS